MNKRLSEIEKELAIARLKETLPKTSQLKISPLNIEYDDFRQIWTIKQDANILKLKVYVTLEEPYVNTPEGKLSVNFEESLNINPYLQQWIPNVPKIIYARFIDRVLRSSINLHKLYIDTKEGYKSVSINIDIYSLIEEGTVCDLALAGINAALNKLELTFDNVTITDWLEPVTMITLYVITERSKVVSQKANYKIFTEPTKLEKDCAEVELLIAIGKDKYLKGIQKLKPNLLDETALIQCLNWTVENIDKLFSRDKYETKI